MHVAVDGIVLEQYRVYSKDWRVTAFPPQQIKSFVALQHPITKLERIARIEVPIEEGRNQDCLDCMSVDRNRRNSVLTNVSI